VESLIGPDETALQELKGGLGSGIGAQRFYYHPVSMAEEWPVDDLTCSLEPARTHAWHSELF